MFTFAACSATNQSPESYTENISRKNLTQDNVHKIIRETGKKNGWIMTEFKNDTLIAEKVDGDDTKSVTVKFNKSSFFLSPSDSDLEDALKDALK